MFRTNCLSAWMSIALLVISSLSLSQNPNALRFDGVDDYVQTTFDGINGMAPRTVEAWIRTSANANPNNGGIQQIITDWGTFVTGGRFTFNVLWNDAIRLEVGGNGVSGTIPVNDNIWHHVAAVYDPDAADEITLYVDGEFDTSGNLTVALNTVSGTDLRIGRRVDDERQFNGIIDEVRVFDYARTQVEIQETMNSEFCGDVDGLVAYYTFNHGVAAADNTGIDMLEDYSGDNDGTLMNFLLMGPSSNWVNGASLESSSDFVELSESVCGSYFWEEINGVFDESGVYSATFTNAAGCDSIVSLDLDILPTYADTTVIAACQTYYWEEFDMNYDESGVYAFPFVTEAGCDSIVALNLTIGEPSQTQIDVSSCGPYNWGGILYESSGEYSVMLESSAGCDSILTLNLQVNETEFTDFFMIACDSYNWNGVELDESGLYVDTLTNVLGCDSIVTLNLEIETLNAEVIDNGDGSLSALPEGASYQWIDCADDSPVEGENNIDFSPAESGSYAVIVNTTICGEDVSDCVEVVVESIEEMDLQCQVFPNPSSGKATISAGGIIEEIWLYNTIGQLVLFQKPAANAIDLDLSAHKSGLYQLLVKSNGQTALVQLILE